jgi:hypothetical protein
MRLLSPWALLGFVSMLVWLVPMVLAAVAASNTRVPLFGFPPTRPFLNLSYLCALWCVPLSVVADRKAAREIAASGGRVTGRWLSLPSAVVCVTGAGLVLVLDVTARF